MGCRGRRDAPHSPIPGGENCESCDVDYSKPYLLLSGAYEFSRTAACKDIPGFRDITDYVECRIAAAGVGLNAKLERTTTSTSDWVPGYCNSNTDGGFYFNSKDTAYNGYRHKRICANARLDRPNCSDGTCVARGPEGSKFAACGRA